MSRFLDIWNKSSLKEKVKVATAIANTLMVNLLWVLKIFITKHWKLNVRITTNLSISKKNKGIKKDQ